MIINKAYCSIILMLTVGILSGCSSSSNNGPTDKSLKSIVISGDNSQIGNGLHTGYSAIGMYADGTTNNITESVTWDSTNTAISTISNKSGSNGVATGISVGSTKISANLHNIVSNKLNLNITNAIIRGIVITPESSIVHNGFMQNYTATAEMSDNTHENVTLSSNWHSSEEIVASINNNGIATAKANSGTSQITAGYGSIMSNIATITATSAVLESVSITPNNAVIIPTASNGSGTLQLGLIGYYSDGTSSPLTGGVWSIVSESSPSGESVVASIMPNGLVTANNISAPQYQSSVGTPGGPVNPSAKTYQGGYANVLVSYSPDGGISLFTDTKKVYVGNYICYPLNQLSTACTCMQDTISKDVWLTIPRNIAESWSIAATYADNLNTANNGAGTCGYNSGWGLATYNQFSNMIKNVPASYISGLSGMVYMWFQRNGFPELQSQGYWGECVDGSSDCMTGSAWHFNATYGVVYKNSVASSIYSFPVHSGF